MAASLEELVARITASAKVISPLPSAVGNSEFLTNDASKSVRSEIAPDATESVQRARRDLLNASRELQQFVSEPSEYLEQHQVNVSFVFLIVTSNFYHRTQ